jgi:hypothetical protein
MIQKEDKRIQKGMNDAKGDKRIQKRAKGYRKAMKEENTLGKIYSLFR